MHIRFPYTCEDKVQNGEFYKDEQGRYHLRGKCKQCNGRHIIGKTEGKWINSKITKTFYPDPEVKIRES